MSLENLEKLLNLQRPDGDADVARAHKTAAGVS